MTLAAPTRLAITCGVTLEASAMRVAESTDRACAAVLSGPSRIVWVAPSWRFVDAFGDLLAPGRALDRRSMAWRYFAEGIITSKAELVPSAAWLDSPGEPPILEHSLPGSEPGTLLTMLWAPYHDDRRQPPAQRSDALAFAP